MNPVLAATAAALALGLGAYYGSVNPLYDPCGAPPVMRESAARRTA